MKNRIFIAIVLISLCGCKKKESPADFPPELPIAQGPPRPNFCFFYSAIVKTNPGTGGRNVLLEDYTGHTCGSSPRAARRAESILATHGANVVIIANHVSEQFARPESDTLYKEDFRNTSSTEWDVFFGMSNVGLPRGAVNRIQPFTQSDASWASLVNTELAKPHSAMLELTSTYDPTQHILNIKTKATFLQSFATDIMLSIVLTEDSIFGDQKDYAPPTGANVILDRRPDYLFKRVLVGAVNGTWGQLVKKSPATNDVVTIDNFCYSLEKCYYTKAVCVNDKHVSIVAFVYRNDTKEVLQVEKLKIR